MMSGSIAPSAAALTGFAGTRSVNHCASPGAVAGAALPAVADCRSPSATDGSMSRRARIGAAMMVASIAAEIASAAKTIRLRMPSRVSERSSVIETMPTDQARDHQRDDRHANGIDENDADRLDESNQGEQP